MSLAPPTHAASNDTAATASVHVAPVRLLRIEEVLTLVGLKRSALYEMIRRGTFPVGRRIAARHVAWRADDIAGWIDSRPVAQQPRQAA